MSHCLKISAQPGGERPSRAVWDWGALARTLVSDALSENELRLLSDSYFKGQFSDSSFQPPYMQEICQWIRTLMAKYETFFRTQCDLGGERSLGMLCGVRRGVNLQKSSPVFKFR